jgi:hypothetical protein
MVKRNGLISENKTALKNATDILSSSATKVSKSVSTHYIEVVSLVTAKSKTSKIERLAATLPLPIQQNSRRRHIQRFLNLKRLSVVLLWFPLIQQIINRHIAKGKQLIIALDRTQWKENNILMVSAIYLNRALPIFWILLDKNGASSLREQQIVLRPVIKLFKTHKLVIIGDREFHSVELAHWLHRQRVKFVFRQKQDTTFRQNRQKFKSAVSGGDISGNETIPTNITLTQKKGFGRFN